MAKTVLQSIRLLQTPALKVKQRAAQAHKRVSFLDVSAIQMAVSSKYFCHAQ